MESYSVKDYLLFMVLMMLIGLVTLIHDEVLVVIVFFFGSNPISWSSKKQASVARSSTEAEYRSLANSAAEVLWLCKLLQELHILLPAPPILLCDNQSTISYSSNPVFHSRMNHLAIDYNFVRELVQSKDLQVPCISTVHQVANIFTKDL